MDKKIENISLEWTDEQGFEHFQYIIYNQTLKPGKRLTITYKAKNGRSYKKVIYKQ